MRTRTTLAPRSRRRSGQTGQSLTVAIIVLFLLLFLGGLFIALVINNLRGARSAAQRTSAVKFAEAGLRYLDEQLTRSPEGADWRPAPDDLPGDLNPTPDPNAAVNDIDPNDPDYFWLCEVNPGRDGYSTGGVPLDYGPYTRVAFGGPTPSRGNAGGRALVRVVYRPASVGVAGATLGPPEAKYLRLDSVGRVGSVDPRDPTTYGNSEGKGLRRELVAFKAIGLTDYLRFFTNKENRSVPATLGAANQVLDAPGGSGSRPDTAPLPRDIVSVFDGPIRSNASLTFHGINLLNLRPLDNDAIEVAGTINLAGVNQDVTSVGPGFPTRVFVNTGLSGTPNLLPSLSPAFQTLDGLVRDNPAGLDTRALPSPDSRNLRAISRLEPPVIDETIGPNGLTRYRASTRNAEPLDAQHMSAADAASLAALGDDVPGQIGWGAGMYLNNREDVQRESESLIGAYSLRSDWLNPGLSPYWRGDFKYVPPGVRITFTPRYIKIERSPTSTGRSYFRNPAGQRLAPNATIVRYSRPQDPAPSAGLPTGGLVYKYAGYPTERVTINGLTVNRGDFVIFAEGNVEVRGTVGGRDPETGEYYERHVTVVSNENIYIGGNLQRDNLNGSDAVETGIQGRSSIALLARNYVTVNTTQFLQPDEGLVKAEEPGSDTRALFLNAAPGSNALTLRLNAGGVDAFNNPPWPLPAIAFPRYEPMLFLRHSADTVAGTAIRLGVNDTGGVPNPQSFAIPGRSVGPGATTLLVGGPVQNVGAYLNDVVPLTVNLLYPNHNDPVAPTSAVGIDNVLRILYDASAGLDNQADYRLTRVGVAPLDIRIEALIYAQERSFFILPGPWFNPDPNDTYERYVLPDPTRPGTGARLARAGDTAGQQRIDPRFPFYGQPMDIRITLFGAISENLPAEIGDQGAWLEKWGWIPNYFGSTGLPTAPGYPATGAALPTFHGRLSPFPALTGPEGAGVGLVYQYDRRWSAPGNTRLDPYGRQLPLAPRLPVAPGLLYAGEDPRLK